MIVDVLPAPDRRAATMLRIIWIILQAAVSAFRSRRVLVLESLALRLQTASTSPVPPGPFDRYSLIVDAYPGPCSVRVDRVTR